MRRAAACMLIAGAFAAGLAWGQDPDRKKSGSSDLKERLAQVRREVKQIKLDTALKRVAPLVEREKQYAALVQRMKQDAAAGKSVNGLLEQARSLKMVALKDLNSILELHIGKYAGIGEKDVWSRLRNARFTNVHYDREWLVNILDDLEESAKINIELDARVYKFDTVSFDFDKTSARAMLQIMGDTLLFNWIVRGDTLYVYKERHETLFGGAWIKKKKAAWKARKEAMEKAIKEAEGKALEDDDGGGGK